MRRYRRTERDFTAFNSNPRFGKIAEILRVNDRCFVLLATFSRPEFDDPFYVFDYAPVSRVIAPLKKLSSPVIYHQKKVANRSEIVVLCMPY